MNTEILAKLQPLIYTVFFAVILWRLIVSIAQGKIKDIPFQLLVYCVILYIISDPTKIMLFGKSLVGLVESGFELITETLGGAM